MLEYHFSISNLVQYSVDEILNYGCWCQLENPDLYQYHKGPPVDNIDRKCQNRKRCHKCITMDTQGTCDPSTQVYSAHYDISGKKFVCQSTGNDCIDNTCSCDVDFVNSLIFSLSELNNYYMNSYGWNPAEQCHANPF